MVDGGTKHHHKNFDGDVESSRSLVVSADVHLVEGHDKTDLRDCVGQLVEADAGTSLTYLSNTGFRTVPARCHIFKLIRIESKDKAWVSPLGDMTQYYVHPDAICKRANG